jgi:hypothetical protein
VTSGVLTYMSLRSEINTHVGVGRLTQLHLFVPELPEKREIYITPTLNVLLHGPWGNASWEKRWYRARQQLDDFIDGLLMDRIFVRSASRKKSSAFMSRLDPDSDEIWEIRVRDPKPGLRIFGSFICQDTFVALTSAPHECLNNEDDWNRTIQEYKGEWTRHFSSTAFRGSYPNDYLTNAFVLD